MKRPTGNLGWLQVSEEQKKDLPGSICFPTPLHSAPLGYIVLCEEQKDLHTDEVSWRPVMSLRGVVEV